MVMRKEAEEFLEQNVLGRVRVRLVLPEEKERWDELVRTRHYLRSARMVGEQLRYVAEVDGQWMGLLGWSAGSYHLKWREQWLGWSEVQRRQRLALVANNARYLLLDAAGRWPNLASRALGLCCQRLSEDWRAAYGHPILAVESFVDSQLFRGTAYKSSGWRSLGQTQGFERVREDFYTAHGRPKQLWVKTLHPRAQEWLAAAELPPELAGAERDLPIDEKIAIPSAQLLGLWEWLAGRLRDSRHAKGLRYRLPTLIGLTLLALLCGVTGGYRQLAAFARRLGQKQREKLRCWKNQDTGRYEVPDEATFYRVLSGLEPGELYKILFEWQRAQSENQGRPFLAVDGKEARRGQQAFLGACDLENKRWVACEPVGEKTNEIPVAQKLFGRLKLDGQLCMLDALHTQLETARTIVMESGGDYILPVKDNQPTLHAQLQTLLPESFPPSGPDEGEKSRAHRGADHRRGCDHS